eukprot:4501187-Amphidinium_carterae.1
MSRNCNPYRLLLHDQTSPPEALHDHPPSLPHLCITRWVKSGCVSLVVLKVSLAETLRCLENIGSVENCVPTRGRSIRLATHEPDHRDAKGYCGREDIATSDFAV